MFYLGPSSCSSRVHICPQRSDSHPAISRPCPRPGSFLTKSQLGSIFLWKITVFTQGRSLIMVDVFSLIKCPFAMLVGWRVVANLLSIPEWQIRSVSTSSRSRMVELSKVLQQQVDPAASKQAKDVKTKRYQVLNEQG